VILEAVVLMEKMAHVYVIWDCFSNARYFRVVFILHIE
jgi:hypothetical protein